MYGVVKPFHSGRVGGGVFGGFLFWWRLAMHPCPPPNHSHVTKRWKREAVVGGGAMTALAVEPPHEHIPPPNHSHVTKRWKREAVVGGR